MNYSAHTVIPDSQKVAKIERLGKIFLRYGLTVAIGWIAAMKVTDYEAKVIEPLIAHSPFLHWGYSDLREWRHSKEGKARREKADPQETRHESETDKDNDGCSHGKGGEKAGTSRR